MFELFFYVSPFIWDETPQMASVCGANPPRNFRWHRCLSCVLGWWVFTQWAKHQPGGVGQNNGDLKPIISSHNGDTRDKSHQKRVYEWDWDMGKSSINCDTMVNKWEYTPQYHITYMYTAPIRNASDWPFIKVESHDTTWQFLKMFTSRWHWT